MKFSKTSSGLLLGMILLLSTGAQAASTGSFKLDEPITVNGTQLAKGDYKVGGDWSQHRIESRPIQEDCSNGASAVG
jgi:hypothetical protein